MDITYRLMAGVQRRDPTQDQRVQRAIQLDNERPNTSELLWKASTVNPLNLPSSLNTDGPVQWKITGSNVIHGDGNIHIYALPISLQEHGDLPVSNIMIKIQGPRYWDEQPGMCRVLQLLEAYAAQVMGPEVNHFVISKYVLRALGRWSATYDDFNDFYRKIPYGSGITIKSCGTEVEPNNPRVKVVKRTPKISGAHRYTNRLLPSDSPFDNPPIVFLDELAAVSQLHDTVTLVTIPSETEDKLWVLKTNSRASLRLEAKNLSLLAEYTGGSHPNLMGLPAYRVIRSGHPNPRPCGMIFPYYAKGTLATVIDQRRVAGTLSLSLKFAWSLQLVEAVTKILSSEMAYHSSLKPNNILVNDDDTLRVIDMEQGGNWAAFAPPEVNYPRHFGQGNAAWDDMGPYQADKAEVFAVGKILWCIFEGWSHSKNTDEEVWSVALPAGCEFPAFSSHQTPTEVRDLILACVSGAVELEEGRRWDADLVLVDGVQFPRGQTGEGGERRATAAETIRHAQEMYRWKEEVARKFTADKIKWRKERAAAAAAGSSSPSSTESEDPTWFCIDKRPTMWQLGRRLRKLETKLCA